MGSLLQETGFYRLILYIRIGKILEEIQQLISVSEPEKR